MTNPKDTESARHETEQDKDSTKRAKGAPAFEVRGGIGTLKPCHKELATREIPMVKLKP